MRFVTYSVAMVDVMQEVGSRAEWAALASPAHSPRYSISFVTSTIAALLYEKNRAKPAAGIQKVEKQVDPTCDGC